jgi:hypothetical protein
MTDVTSESIDLLKPLPFYHVLNGLPNRTTTQFGVLSDIYLPVILHQCQMRDGTRFADIPGCVPEAPLHRAGGRLFRVEGDQGA